MSDLEDKIVPVQVGEESLSFRRNLERAVDILLSLRDEDVAHFGPDGFGWKVDMVVQKGRIMFQLRREELPPLFEMIEIKDKEEK